jgi:hypothetical protein
MNPRSIFVAGAVTILSLGPSAADEMADLRHQLTLSLTEALARQRTKAREQDAIDQANRNLPDLSKFGTPVDVPVARRAAPSHGLHCTTINMGDGDSETDCD